MAEIKDVKLYHGQTVAIRGHSVKTHSFPDWDISYIEYWRKVDPLTGIVAKQDMQLCRDIIRQLNFRTLKVTGQRIYFVEH